MKHNAPDNEPKKGLLNYFFGKYTEQIKEILNLLDSFDEFKTLKAYDPEPTIIPYILENENLKLFKQQYPELVPPEASSIISINVISSSMLHAQKYKKIKYFFTPEGKLIKKFEN